MILNFKKRFPWGSETMFQTKILEDIKLHSIRLNKNNRYIRGTVLQLSTGSRTKFYNCFKSRICTGVQKIIIREVDFTRPSFNFFVYTPSANDKKTKPKFFEVIVDGRVLSKFEIQILAKNDGFDSTCDFFRWFYDGYEGYIIHWTSLRY